MNVLHPNIHQEDKMHGGESSDDDEVPQSFMIEATSRRPERHSKGKNRETAGGDRQHPLHSVAGRRLPPVLPTHHPSPTTPTNAKASPATDDDSIRPTSAGGYSEPSTDRDSQPKQMRGLDAHERALWNWVNVYNLDGYIITTTGRGFIALHWQGALTSCEYYLLACYFVHMVFLYSRTVGFVIGFSTFLLGCIDYSKIHPDKSMRLSAVIVDRCVSK
jgi:autophagy-related protein 9